MRLWVEMLPDSNWVKRGRVDRSGHALTPTRARYLQGAFFLRFLIILVVAAGLSHALGMRSLSSIMMTFAWIPALFEHERLTDIAEAMGPPQTSILDPDKVYLYYMLLAVLLLGAAFFCFGDPVRVWLGEQALVQGIGAVVSKVWAVLGQPPIWFSALVALTTAMFALVLKLERELEAEAK
jgi:hypothetical protein